MVFISILSSHAQAQENPILGKFSLSESKGQVSMYWQILAGRTCNGIQIYRSTDKVNYSRIGFIGGICGSVTEPVNYFFVDTVPVLNMINYYYLEFGGVGTSPVIAVEIVDKRNGGYQIRPHPIQNTGRIYFEAIGGEVYILRVYDLLGHELFSDETLAGFFEITTRNLSSGSYMFTISSTDSGDRITGQLLIQQ
jgi:hypothetical protein